MKKLINYQRKPFNITSKNAKETLKERNHSVVNKTLEVIFLPFKFCFLLLKNYFIVLSPESTRTIRSCGWIKQLNRNCLSLDSSFSKGGVCQCFEEGCNSGFSLTSLRLPTLLGIIAFIYFVRS